jgi:hypothetical protein
MSNRLSHSAMNKFLACGESYRLHYVERVRPKEVGSSLPFGSAIGKTFEYILKGEKSEDFANDYEYFDYQWSFQTINDELVNIQTYPNLVYSKYDLDYDLLTNDEKKLSPNLQSWNSLRHKGHLIIDSFKKNLLPKIKKVYSTEEFIELENNDGDSSIGYADCVVDIEGYDKPVILDFKTAAWEYELESVQRSVQLSQYLHVLSEKYNTRLAGYAVFLKNMEKNRTKFCIKCGFDGSAGKFKTCNNEIGGKRCNGDWKETLRPECKMQLIVDVLPQETEDFIIGNIENVNNAIKNQVFVKNVDNCWNTKYNRPCEYVNLCWKKDLAEYKKLEKKV